MMKAPPAIAKYRSNHNALQGLGPILRSFFIVEFEANRILERGRIDIVRIDVFGIPYRIIFGSLDPHAVYLQKVGYLNDRGIIFIDAGGIFRYDTERALRVKIFPCFVVLGLCLFVFDRGIVLSIFFFDREGIILEFCFLSKSNLRESNI